MKSLIYKNNYFFILHLLFLLSGAYLLLNYSKDDVLWLLIFLTQYYLKITQIYIQTLLFQF